MGYSSIAITDHVDLSNLDFVVPRLVMAARELNETQAIRVIPGAEITNVHVARLAKDCGVRLVLNSDAHSPMRS